MVDLIANTIKESGGTAEDSGIVLSFWDYDKGSPEGSDYALPSITIRKIMPRRNNNRKSRLIRLQSVRSTRLFSTSSFVRKNPSDLDSKFTKGGIDSKLSLYNSFSSSDFSYFSSV